MPEQDSSSSPAQGRVSDKYVALNDALHDYVVRHCTHREADDPVLRELRAETEKLGSISRMMISPDQASFMRMLTSLLNVQTAIEVGTFTGLSALSMARGLAEGGRLYCFDVSHEWTGIARRYWERAGVSDRITLTIGPAADTLPQVLPGHTVDLAFIDADKTGYDSYLELIFPHMRTNGLFIFDNMIQAGRIVEAESGGHEDNPSVQAIHALNEKLAADERLESVFLTVADGLMLCRKK